MSVWVMTALAGATGFLLGLGAYYLYVRWKDWSYMRTMERRLEAVFGPLDEETPLPGKLTNEDLRVVFSDEDYR